MIGIECTEPEIALRATSSMLARGLVMLPGGDGGRVLSLTPPLSIGEDARCLACDNLRDVLEAIASSSREDAGVSR